MPTANVTLQDGTKARVTFENDAQLDSAIHDLQEQVKDRDANTLGGPGDLLTQAVGGPALKMITGMAGAAVGGVEGMARGAGAGAASLAMGEGLDKARTAFVDEAAGTIENRERAMTVEPRSKISQAADRIVSKPFELLEKGSDVAGEKVSEVLGPAAGAATKVAVQAAPGVVLGMMGRKVGGRTPAGGAKADPGGPREPPPGAPSNEVAPVTAEQLKPPQATSAPPPPDPMDPAATRANLASQRGQVPREAAPPRQAAQEAPGAGQPSGAPTGRPAGEPAAAAPERGATPQEQRARAYARNLGLDWARLGAGVRASLTTIAEDAGALERLDPAATKRQAALGSLKIPVQATRGQLTRDSVALRREAIASNTTEGQPIRDVDIAANRDLQANLEALRGRVGGLKGGLHDPVDAEGVAAAEPSIRAETKTPSRVGESAQTAAREKAKWSKKGYDALYKIARETEPTAEAPLEPVTALLKENPDIQHLGWVKSWLGKARSVKGLPEDAPLERVTLNELDDLRKLSQKYAGGTDAHFARELRTAVDKAMESVPEGAKAWGRARDAFQKHQREFKDQDIVRKLTSKKRTSGDRALALEKTWNTVATGPLEQLRQVKKTLMTGGTSATRTAGRKAWRDMRAETVNRILEDARNVTAADETERAILTEAALRRSIKRIPRENLDELLGKGNVRELNNILRARRITTRSPVGGRTTQSGTVPNALVMFEKVLKHIPGGKYAVGAKHALTDLGERGASGRVAEEAVRSPLEEAAQRLQQQGPAPTIGQGGATPAPGTIGSMPTLKRP